MNKRFPLVLYEKALVPGSFERMFEDTAKLGFAGFELSVDESDMRLARLDWSDKDVIPVIIAAKQAGIKLQSLCFSGQRRFPMGSADASIVSKSMTMMQKSIDLCQNLGIRVLQVAGFDVYYEPASADTYKRYCENLCKAACYAESRGVTLAIEPVETGVLDIEMALDIVHTASSPFLQVYPDIANMASLGIDYFPQFEKGIGHIAQVHVRDAIPNYFYGVDIGTGIIDFDKTFELFDRIGLNCPLTLEMWNLENPKYMETVGYARQFLENHIQSAGKLTRKVI